MRPHHRPERHYAARIGWLRAAVLGANDGIVSTASLLVGVAAADVSHHTILIAGIAGLVAGAMSMAAGEYISVSSQADTVKADLEREQQELATDEAFERKELARIYVQRGLDPDLAEQVAAQLMAHDALGAHARDELGLTDTQTARPIQAAITSAATFTIGAAMPLVVAMLTPLSHVLMAVGISSLLCLALLGAVAAWAGGANVLVGTIRVTVWGTLAMIVTAAVGAIIGPTV
ncbi:MAG: VIT family protein [Nitrospirae bacterium]|nr:MAG: VIT family protein [Nitrospirota bacterium]